MSTDAKRKLPPNPYVRSPIKKLDQLAGRARELKSIRYYLDLTASGQSPHLALIGQRGVGKTSLLNGSEAIAKDMDLLPVRLNMNEQKATSPGRFWHDLYSTLILSLAKVGCWGGEQGPIYAETFRMIHSRQPGSLDKAVLQIPFALSCHRGSIDSFECPDALVEHDLDACIVELDSRGLTGIAILIDEADCLGKNVPLLQMFRNIFQTVSRCSLLLAGTEAVFPALSEVFSPIPRQFHRIDIKPFAQWSDTYDLALRPLPKDISRDVAPKRSVIQELHDLCGGDPAEVQLYCHHMYRNIEDGSSKRMSLAPQVFREVLREYRSNTPANVDAVLNAIEKLPDKLLFKSPWLARRNVTLEDNIRVEVLQNELKSDRTLSVSEKDGIRRDLEDGYKKLFDEGIIESDNRICLVGSPLTGGFWKSFVEAERRNRWTWDDDTFAENLWQRIILTIAAKLTAAPTFFRLQNGDDALVALQSIREGQRVTELNESIGDMIVAAIIAREYKASFAADITLRVDSPAGRHTVRCRLIEKPDAELTLGTIEEWVENHKVLLAGSEISIVVSDFGRWLLPTAGELHRLGHIAKFPIPAEFGPSPVDQTYAAFRDGNIQGCADGWTQILADKEDAQGRNNLAFCQLLLGLPEKALENATRAVATECEPLYELNKGLAEFMTGKKEQAMKTLDHALQELQAEDSEFDASSALYVLLLELSGSRVGFHADTPIDAAILINVMAYGCIVEGSTRQGIDQLVS